MLHWHSWVFWAFTKPYAAPRLHTAPWGPSGFELPRGNPGRCAYGVGAEANKGPSRLPREIPTGEGKRAVQEVESQDGAKLDPKRHRKNDKKNEALASRRVLGGPWDSLGRFARMGFRGYWSAAGTQTTPGRISSGFVRSKI